VNWPLLLFALLLLVGTAAIYFYRNWKRTMRYATLATEVENYRNVIDQANDAMFVIDIVDGRIHQINPSAANLLQYSPEELLRKTLFDIQVTTNPDRCSRIVADVWEQWGLIFSDIPFITRDGEVIPVECSARVAPFDGRPTIVIYARDISECLRLERELQDQAVTIE
jgi:PAS domain S-box-containing protein